MWKGTVHTAISDGSLPLSGIKAGEFLVADHDNVAGSMLGGTLCASVCVPGVTECTVWATSPKGEENLYRLLSHGGTSLEGCVVGSGVGGILPILAADEEWIGWFLQKVRGCGGEPIIEIPPTISPEAYRKIASIENGRQVASLFWHGGGPAQFLSRPSRHPTTRFLHPRHPLGDDSRLARNSQGWAERVRYSAHLSFPAIREEDCRRFVEQYGCEEVDRYGKWLPIVVVATRFVEELRKAGVVCNLRGSGGASAILRRAFGFPPPEEGLSIERFISPHRTSPPDIDIDTEDRAKALLVLDNVCREMGLRCYRLSAYSDSPQGTTAVPAPAGCIVVPGDFPMPLLSPQPEDGLPPVTQIPTALADKMSVCKIDVLQVNSLSLVSELGLDMALGYHLREVPMPQSCLGIPQLQSEIGKRVYQAVRGKTVLTLKDAVLMVCMERPGLAAFAPYILRRYVGVDGAEHLFPNARTPRGRIFLFQEAMIKYVASRLGSEAAERFRKEIKSRVPSQWVKQVARELGIEESACKYLYNLAHARAYAAVVMLFAHAMNTMPNEYFRFWYCRASNDADKERIAREAQKYGVSL